MPGWVSQSRASAPFTVRPAFLHHGCCGPYGGIASIHQRLLRWHLSQIFWDKFHLEHLEYHPQAGPALLGVRRCARPPPALELSDPYAQPPRGPHSLVPTPTLAGRSLVTAIAASGGRLTVGGRDVAAAAVAAATDLSSVRGGVPTRGTLVQCTAHAPHTHMHLSLT